VVTLNCISVGSRAAFEALVTATEVNELRPVVGRVFGIGKVHAAYAHLAAAAHFGKLAIKFD